VDETNVHEEVLLDLVEEITNKLQAGEPVDLEVYAREYPEYIERLQNVLPSLELFADLGHSDENDLLDSHPTPDADPLQGCLGDYQVVREVGRGGMGVVYESTHRSLGRRAALKVLPFAAMLDQRQIQRFKNEAQAVAQLDHPNIVDVFGVGCDRGVHYYAMRFIDGRTLSEMIVALRQSSQRDSVVADAAETPRNQDNSTSRLKGFVQEQTADGGTVSPARSTNTNSEDTPLLASFSTKASTKNRAYYRSVADLVRQVAEALEHAHQQGVIHRDIKPSNLILEDNGKLWVTDFGLAHIENAATLTMTGDVVGTLRYMSPEQARGVPVDHRTDIYSLGATLYELLTLQPAFPQHDRQELSRKIAFEDPAAPRHLNRAIPADLETIVLKSLEKNPAERYETAEIFANDLLSFIEDRPIVARRPTVLDRAMKWSRRHRPIVAAVAAVLLFSIIGLTVSTLFMANAAGVATRERTEADTQRTRAVANERLALQALDEMFIEVFERRFPKQQLTPTDHALLEKALTFYEGFAIQNAQYKSSRHETAKAYRRVGDIQTKLASSKKAEDAYRRSILFYEELTRDFPREPDFLQGIASSTNNLGIALQAQQIHSEAEKAYRQALEIESRLVNKFTDQPSYLEELARTYNNLGVLLSTTQRDEAADEAFLAARQHWQQLADQSEDLSDYHHHLATSHVNLANLWQNMDHRSDAKQALERALEIAQPLVDSSGKPEYQEQLARTLNSMGVLLMRDEEFSESEVAFREAVPNWQKLATGYVNVPEFQEKLTQTCKNLATLLRDKPESALWLRRARDTLERTTEQFPGNRKYHEQLAKTNDRLGEFFRARGQLREASDAYLEASSNWKTLIDNFAPTAEYQQQLSKTYNVLGIIFSATGRPSEAESAYRNALDVLDQMPTEQSQQPGHRGAVAKICHNLGLLLGIGQVDESEQFLRRGHLAFVGLREAFPTKPSYQHSLAASQTALGNLLSETDRAGQAEEQFRQALLLRETLAEKFPSMAAMQNSLAWFLVSSADTGIRDSTRALQYAQKAVKRSPESKGFWNTLGVAQYRTGGFEAAIASLKRSQSIDSTGESADLFFLAMSQQQLGNREVARVYFDQACAWMKKNKPHDIELRRFRTEAATLLEIEAQ
jgi:serine/threonine protein kinase/tetratricopeptide (TPR) repeat protein